MCLRNIVVYLMFAVTVLFPLSAKATCDSLIVNLSFRYDSDSIELGYMNNKAEIEKMSDFLDSASNCPITFKISVCCSPEGLEQYNRSLSVRRVSTIERLIRSLPDIIGDVSVENLGENWTEFLTCLYQQDVPDKDKVLAIVENPADSHDVKEKKLKTLSGGVPWRYMKENIFPNLRYAHAKLICCREEVQDSVPTEPVVVEVIPVEPATLEPAPVATEVIPMETVPVVTDTVEKPEPQRRNLRLGTNVLYDVITVANLSLEYGFSKNFSIGMLCTFSPWDVNSTTKVRTLILQPEFRYYFRQGFTGHHIGIEGHVGWYNVALPGSDTRYQDRDGNTPLYGGGISYGYCIPISKNRRWNLDFDIAAGYARFDYDCFYNTPNGALFDTGNRNYWGITKLGVTFYYNFKIR